MSVEETVTGSDSVLVAPSIFNAAVDETAQVLDTVLATAVFFATITEGALAADQIIARLLWEIINDSQTANWASINDAQTPGWSEINNSQSTTWQSVKTQG